ncbi:hypothetical protein [Comamonas sp. JC664]|uniref:hypothetical protein n=1 Tax=Comamonas sp. JC664 TaxID=2801917 RepID=UPI00174ACD19|nr:hypothetical protein [Comamonas sp. JC664]MBL0698196.1 hypothetical protein [Comamonas sp. JC664]GHG88899.1 hypothetical protein GCM10012319_47850 [Comamonas sp. KCTC 72670]
MQTRNHSSSGPGAKKLAVLVIHGIEVDDPGLFDTAVRLLHKHFGAQAGAHEDALAVETVNWASVMERAEKDLLARYGPPDAEAYWKSLYDSVRAVNQGHESALVPLMLRMMRPSLRGMDLRYPGLRWMLVHFVGDIIAYQTNPADPDVYTRIHRQVAEALGRLREKAGDDAPLCVIAHSLGSVIASNYFYDLQVQRFAGRDIIEDSVRAAQGTSPLERGETLSHFFTLGSPMALWSLRYPHAGLDQPVHVPAPELARHHPGVGGQWINFYDDDDVFAWPLQPLSEAYRDLVEDRSVRVAGPLFSWTPLVHPFYWSDDGVMRDIAASLAGAWKQLANAPSVAA